MTNINQGAVGQVGVPRATLDEPRLMFRRVEVLFAVADTIEERVKLATARADKLPQAILSKAFRGELVPTEAELARAEGRGYETAEEMMARSVDSRDQEARGARRGQAVVRTAIAGTPR